MLSRFLRRLPKCELHAHVNGCISPAVARRLVQVHRENFPGQEPPRLPPTWAEEEEEARGGGLEEGRSDFDFRVPFGIFPLVQKLTSHPGALREAVRGIVEEFGRDGVRYLELRSTPRESGSMSEEEYVATLVDEIGQINHGQAGEPTVTTRLLLSIDRTLGLEKASRTVDLAAKHKESGIVVGLDLSGDPTRGDARELVPLLRKARDRSGLRLSLHVAEVPNAGETGELLRLAGASDRLGHATCVHPSCGGDHGLWRLLLEGRTPVEVCLTSNLRCGSVAGGDLSSHHAARLARAGHPLVVCTDDSAVFGCHLSGEYSLFAKHCMAAEAEKEEEDDVDKSSKLKEALFSLSRRSIGMTFASEEVKQRLGRQWEFFAKEEGLDVKGCGSSSTHAIHG